MVASVTSTLAAVSSPSLSRLAGASLLTGASADAQKALDVAAAKDITADSRVPAAITNQLRALDKLARSSGSDSAPATINPDGTLSTDIEPQLQKGLTDLITSVQKVTDTLSDKDRAAVVAYVARQLSNVKAVFQQTQDAGQAARATTAQQIAKGAPSPISSTGKTPAQIDAAKTGFEDVDAALNKFLDSQGLNSGAVTDLLESFGDVAASANRQTDQEQVDNKTFKQQLDQVTNGLKAAQTDQDSAFGQAFLTALVKGFGSDLSTSLQSSKQHLSDLLVKASGTTATRLKSEFDQYDEKFQTSSQTITNLLSQLAGPSGQGQASLRGALVSAKA